MLLHDRTITWGGGRYIPRKKSEVKETVKQDLVDIGCFSIQFQVYKPYAFQYPKC